MKKGILIVLLSSIGSIWVNAQQDAMFTHYMYNTSSVNPAYAGSREALSITALGRYQWVGFSGAPVTHMLNVNTPFWSEKMGAGLTFTNDKIGPTSKTTLDLDLAYRMKVSKKLNLNFGIKSGLNILNADLTGLTSANASDPVLLAQINNKVLPNFGFGMLLQHDKFYVGASSPRLIENSFASGVIGTGRDFLKQQRHYYFIAGGAIKLSPTLIIKPTTLIKLAIGSPVQVDLTASLVWKDLLNLGAMYRTSDAVGVLVGFNINEQFTVGYSYDYSVNKRSFTSNYSSHEIVLRYDLINKKEGNITSPRYF